MNKKPRLQKSSISLAVKLRDDITMERSGNGRMTLFRAEEKYLDVPDSPLIEALMMSWMTEELIDRLAESSSHPEAVYFLCEKMFSHGLLQAQISIDGQSLLSLYPTPDWRAWKEKMPASLQSLSPYACLRRVGKSILLEMPLSQRKCAFHDENCLVWLMEIVRECAAVSFEDEGRTAFYQALRLMDALVEGETDSAVWEFHDLLFFHNSSIGFHDDPIGATWRLKEKTPPAPLFKSCAGECISLPETNGQLMDKLNFSFAHVLAKRRSRRIPGNRPITLEELGALLDVSARVQEIQDDSINHCLRSLRPSPSGGGLHSLEIYPLVRQCIGLAPGAWRYDPEQHRLESIAANETSLEAYLQSNPHFLIPGAGPPHIHLVLTSRFLRDAWKYEKIAFRLVLQDLGCFYQTFSLTATALGLASCILGTVDARRLGEMMKLDPILEPVIGEMTLSSS